MVVNYFRGDQIYMDFVGLLIREIYIICAKGIPNSYLQYLVFRY